jgi:hypothetical protein
VVSRGKATHKGDLGPLEASNKKVKLAYAEMVRLEEGKIAEMWGYWNNLDLLAQLGAFTPPKVEKSSAPYEGPPKVEDPDEEKAAEEGEGEAKEAKEAKGEAEEKKEKKEKKGKTAKKAKGADEATEDKP